jgi:hypothetical protein
MEAPVSVSRLACLVILVAGTAACGDGPGDPGLPVSVYSLRQLNDSTLPYDHEGLGCCTYLSGQLELDAQDYAISLTARNRNTGETFTAKEWGSYAANGAALTFARDSFLIIGFALDVATVSGDSLRVAFGGEGPGSPDQFDALFVRAP